MRLRTKTKRELEAIKGKHHRRSLDAVITDILLPPYKNHNKSGLEIALQNIEAEVGRSGSALGDENRATLLQQIAKMRKRYTEETEEKE